MKIYSRPSLGPVESALVRTAETLIGYISANNTDINRYKLELKELEENQKGNEDALEIVKDYLAKNFNLNFDGSPITEGENP